VTYTLTPALPAGLTLNRNTRTIVGTPTAFAPTRIWAWTARDGDGDTIRIRFPLTVHGTDVCGRTPLVQTRILQEVGVPCEQVTAAHLGALVTLNLSDALIPTLRKGDFDGMFRLGRLDLSGNRLTTLPAGLFDGLIALEWLELADNRLATLPANIFDGLPALRNLLLNGNNLAALPDGLFDGLDLSQLWLDSNTGAPFPLNLELEQQGGGQVRVRLRQAAPLDLRMFWTATGGATGTGNVLLEAGRRVTEVFGVPANSPVLYMIRLSPGSSGRLAGAGYRGFEVRIPSPAAGVLFTPPSLVLREEEATTYTVRLNHAPTGTVTVLPLIPL